MVDDVTHIRNQNRLLDSVLKIHQEPENMKRPSSLSSSSSSSQWRWTNNQTCNHESRCFLPFTGFHDFLDVGEEEVHVRLAQSVDQNRVTQEVMLQNFQTLVVGRLRGHELKHGLWRRNQMRTAWIISMSTLKPALTLSSLLSPAPSCAPQWRETQFKSCCQFCLRWCHSVPVYHEENKHGMDSRLSLRTTRSRRLREKMW